MANRYWVTGFSNDWSDTSNWSTTSGGIGGSSVPGSSDDAIFDSNSANHSCTLDQNVNVNSWTYSSYSGTVDCVTFDVTTAGNFGGRTGTYLYMGTGTFTIGGDFGGRDNRLYGQTATLRFTTASGSFSLSNRQQDNGPFVEIASGATCVFGFSGNRKIRGLDCYGQFDFGGTYNQLDVYGDVTVRSTGSLIAASSSSQFTMRSYSAFTLEAGASVDSVRFATFRANPSTNSSVTFSGAGWATATQARISLSFLSTTVGRMTYVFPSVMHVRTLDFVPRYSSSQATLDFATNSTQLTIGTSFFYNSTYTSDNFNINVGSSTLTFGLEEDSTFSPRGNTFPPIIISDNAVGTLTLDSNVTTPYVHDCANQLDENGYTVTTTGTDPSPCSTGSRYWVGLVDSDYENSGNWSTSSGGLGNASVPVGTNDVVFDSGSSVNCTMAASRSMNSLNFASYAGTFSAGSHSVIVTNSATASGSTAILDLGSSNWRVGGTWNLRFISTSSTAGTSSIRLTSQTGSDNWLWFPSGGPFSNITLAQNAIINQGRRVDVNGSFTLESGATWNATDYRLNILNNASLTLGANSSITTTATGLVELRTDNSGVRTGNATASIGNFHTTNANTGSVTTIPIATYTGTFVFGQNAASYGTTWRFEGNTVIEGDVSTAMGKSTNETIDLSTNNVSLTLKGDVDITPSQGTITWSAGSGTIIFDNSGSQSVNFNGQTVEGIHVTDASTGSIVLASDFSTAWLRDCDSLIDLNGYTITNADSVDRCVYPYDPPTTIALDSAAAINTDLEGWWHFLEGTGSAVADISTSANNLSHSFGEFDWNVTKIGTAGNLTRTGLLSTSTVPTLTDKLTISQWLYYEGSISRETSFAGNNGGSNFAWAFRTENSGDPMRFIVNGSHTESSQLPLDQWVHIVGVYDGTDIRLYIDGVQDGTPTSVTGNVNSFTSIFIGNQNASSSVFPFTGLVQNSRIWSRALSSSEVSSLHSDPWIGSDYTAVVPPSNRFFSPAAFARLG